MPIKAPAEAPGFRNMFGVATPPRYAFGGKVLENTLTKQSSIPRDTPRTYLTLLMGASPAEQPGIEPGALRMTRRRLLGSAAAIAASAAASALPPNVRRALAQAPPRGGSLGDIKHVVMLMQENRAFDHYFGTMAGVRGFDDPDALKLPNGNSVFYQPDAENPSGCLLPFHLDTRTTSAQRIPTTSHAWAVQHDAWNGGKMDNWMPAHRKADGVWAPYVMGYHTRADIPFQFALAEAFTICDAYHCMPKPTLPGGEQKPPTQEKGPRKRIPKDRR